MPIKVRRLRRDEASDYLREKFDIQRAPRTLAKLAVIGGGPEMEHIGRFPTYREDALDAWATSIIGPTVRSTSELRALRAA